MLRLAKWNIAFIRVVVGPPTKLFYFSFSFSFISVVREA